MNHPDTTPQGDGFVARSQEEADAEFEAAMDLLANQWGMPAGAPAARVVSEMSGRGMSIVPDEMSYREAATCAVALGIDPGHGDEDDDPLVAVHLARSEWLRLEQVLRLMSEDEHEMAREALSDDIRADLEEGAAWLVGIADTIDTMTGDAR